MNFSQEATNLSSLDQVSVRIKIASKQGMNVLLVTWAAMEYFSGKSIFHFTFQGNFDRQACRTMLMNK